MIIELLGPAGAGKSALAELLVTRGALRASLWHLPVRLLVKSAFALVPTALVLVLACRARAVEPLKQMIRIGALSDCWNHGEWKRQPLIVLDEGPMFGLTWIMVSAPDGFRRHSWFQRWRTRILALWAPRMHGVILLDARDVTIAERIRSREKPHVVKEGSDEEIFAFSAAFRKAFALVLNDFARMGGPLPIATPTDDVTFSDLAENVFETLGGSVRVG